MSNFPKPQPDGSGRPRRLFTKRIPHTVAFSLEGDEMELYKAVTHYVQRQSARAAEAGDDRALVPWVSSWRCTSAGWRVRRTR